jgi:hypothetical protein
MKDNKMRKNLTTSVILPVFGSGMVIAIAAHNLEGMLAWGSPW